MASGWESEDMVDMVLGWTVGGLYKDWKVRARDPGLLVRVLD